VSLLVFLIIEGLLGCSRKLSPQEAAAVLTRIQQARQTVTLQGTLTTSILFQGKKLNARAEIHRGAGIIRLKYTSGRFAGWQIIEQDRLVWRVSPQQEILPSLIAPEPELAPPWLARQTRLNVYAAGWMRIAGRQAKRYVIVPIGGRSASRLIFCLDAQTSYPLAIWRYSQRGQLISETRFHSVRYNVSPPPRVVPPQVAQEHWRRWRYRAARVANETELKKQLGGPLLKPAYVPAGFQLRGLFLRQTRWGPAAEIRYSDGVRHFLIMQLKPSPGAAPFMPSSPSHAWPKGREAISAPLSPNEKPAKSPIWRPMPFPPPNRMGEARRPGNIGQQQEMHRPRYHPAQPYGGPFARFQGKQRFIAQRGPFYMIVLGELPSEELQKILHSIPPFQA